MSHKRLSTWQKATALVPLALLSGAWTTSLAATSTASASTAGGGLPDGTSIPTEAIEAPASMTQPGSIAPGVPDGQAQNVIAGSSANGIPAAALAAYQRAEQVINSADASCNLSWQLVAAIGRVESDHGRYGGNVLGEDGKSRPGIYGIPLDGTNGTAEIRDSDAGQYDDDQIFDRAVGPMQFIPSTWSVVGVDGDGDGVRDPQDIDDAALASAVYLCSGDEDLATYGGQKASIYRYNHSEEYVDLVIAIMNAYLGGDYSSVPNGIAAPTVFSPRYGDAVVSAATAGKPQPGDRPGRGGSDGGTPDVSQTGGGSPTGGGTGDNGGAGDTDGTPDGSDLPGGEEPAEGPVETVKKTVKDVTDGVQDGAGEVTDPVDETTGGGLSAAEAKAECLASGLTVLDVAALNACIDDLMNP